MMEGGFDELARRRFGHAIFRHAFVPLLLALPVLSWLFPARVENYFRGSAMHLGTTASLLWITIASIWIAELLYPRASAWNYRLLAGPQGWSRLGRDLFYLFFVTQLTAFLTGKLQPFLERALAGVAPIVWPSHWPFAARVCLAFLIVELADYWFHRACHHAPLLWRFHSTHHAVGELSGLKALRTHPVDNVFFFVARSLSLFVLGAGADEIAAVICFGGVLGILSHANISVAEGPLGLWVNFPRFHAVHHSSALDESRANFGCHTVLWDRVFGTFRRDAREGLTLGIEPLEPRSAWRELAGPFYRSTM